jgi:hypothetical protein
MPVYCPNRSFRFVPEHTAVEKAAKQKSKNLKKQQVDTPVHPRHIRLMKLMKRFLVALTVLAAMPSGVAISAGALPHVPEAQLTNDSTFDLTGSPRGHSPVIRSGPVIPQQTPMRNPAYPSVPLPPRSTAVQSSVRR